MMRSALFFFASASFCLSSFAPLLRLVYSSFFCCTDESSSDYYYEEVHVHNKKIKTGLIKGSTHHNHPPKTNDHHNHNK